MKSIWSELSAYTEVERRKKIVLAIRISIKIKINRTDKGDFNVMAYFMFTVIISKCLAK